MAKNKKIRVGIDAGGTFTDFVLFDGRRTVVHKVLSTPKDPSQAIIQGLGDILEGKFDVASITHGTTVATNALLERKGARVALLTTKGFEDAIEIGRQNRGKLYDLSWERPKPLIERNLRFGVTERADFRGEILIPVDPDEIARLLERLKRLNLGGIAVSFLHSYANSENERQVEKLLTPLGVPISLSSRILPEFREYERTSTTVANAYLLPKVKSYMESLSRNLPRSSVSIMQSSGGVISPEQAGREPVRIVLSGPAGGVVGAFGVAKAAGFKRVLTYDMGGTSTDVSLCEGGIRFTTEATIDGVPIKVPMADVTTIGAGGGSIAYVDSGGALKVGPESAGADPGPACYGRGTLPTVTDANLALGRINAAWFLGGRMKIYPSRAEAALEGLAGRAKMSLREISEGIIRVANANMERALRVISIGRGFDPREFVLVSFGGAGGLHAAELALGLGVGTVIFPQNPGALSALGMLMADAFKDYGVTVFLGGGEGEAIESEFARLREKAAEDFGGEKIRFERFLDVRYRRQSHEITIPYAKGFAASFHKAHRKFYGYAKPKSDIEIVTLRLRAIAQRDKLKPPKLKKSAGDVPSRREPLYFGGAEIEARSYARGDFFPGFRFESPAVVLEATSTLFIPPGFICEVDNFGNIIARVG